MGLLVNLREIAEHQRAAGEIGVERFSEAMFDSFSYSKPDFVGSFVMVAANKARSIVAGRVVRFCTPLAEQLQTDYTEGDSYGYGN